MYTLCCEFEERIHLGDEEFHDVRDELRWQLFHSCGVGPPSHPSLSFAALPAESNYQVLCSYVSCCWSLVVYDVNCRYREVTPSATLNKSNEKRKKNRKRRNRSHKMNLGAAASTSTSAVPVNYVEHTRACFAKATTRELVGHQKEVRKKSSGVISVLIALICLLRCTPWLGIARGGSWPPDQSIRPLACGPWPVLCAPLSYRCVFHLCFLTHRGVFLFTGR